jgi:hypothetical protein
MELQILASLRFTIFTNFKLQLYEKNNTNSFITFIISNQLRY